MYCWEAEDLPATKRNLLASNLLKATSSRRRAARPADADAPVPGRPKFGEELWFPVTEPVEFRRVAVGLADYVWGGRDRTVAYLYLDVDDVPRSDRAVKTSLFGTTYQGPRPRWHNLYGAPRGVQGRRGAPQNRYGAGACGLPRPRPAVPGGADAAAAARGHRAPPQGLRLPADARAEAGHGALPPAGPRADGLGAARRPAPGRPRPLKLGLTVAIGNHVLEYAAAANARGVVEWNEP